MFSVDNFYSFMYSTYGADKYRDIAVYRHFEHGSKNIEEIVLYGADSTRNRLANKFFYSTHGSLILHDQEPFMRDYLNTYRTHRLTTNNFDRIWSELEDHELFLQHFRSCRWPIFCHSEKNSDDIRWLESHGVIGCHYFWHGLIARDWFRHWKHHPNLQSHNENWSHRFLLYALGKSGTRKYRKQLLESISDIKQNVMYNWENDLSITAEYSTLIDIDDAKSSAIHIVAETVFDQNKIHATEKIFKPMVMNQPFLVFAGAGMLDYLKYYGFKTFGSLWDESYDLEPDHKRRFDMLITLIKYLNSLPNNEFNKLMSACQEIVRHNRLHFYSENFESQMLNELRDNVASAIKIQNQRSLDDPGGSFFYVMDRILARGLEPSPGMKDLLSYFSTELKNTNLVKEIKKQYSWFDQ